MSDMLELIESLQTQEASVGRLFGSEGRRAGGSDPRQILEAAKFIDEVLTGKRKTWQLQEAMTRSDFPSLFADVLDRQMLGAYQATTPTWRAIARSTTVPDFRNVKRRAMDGAESTLDPVEELAPYPQATVTPSEDEFSVRKYGRRIDLSWELLINDDLDEFRDLPRRLANAAARSESRFATELYVDAKGPHASLYSTKEFGNIVLIEAKQPKLSLESLQQALTQLSEAVDEDGEPIVVEMATLVVPPGLAVLAENILNAIQIEMMSEGGSEDQKLIAKNWMAGRFNLVVEPYIPYIAKENGQTSWFLFSSPQVGRPALEVGFLRGYEQPSLYERAPDARRVGGGGDALESFDDDSRAWRIRHVFGGGRLTTTGGAKATVASNGSGK